MKAWLADADRLEREVVERAEALAQQLYEQRAFRAVSADTAPKAPAAVDEPEPPVAAPERGGHGPDVPPPG